MARLLAPVTFSTLVMDPLGHVSLVMVIWSIFQQEICDTAIIASAWSTMRERGVTSGDSVTVTTYQCGS